MSCRRGIPKNDCSCCRSLAEKVRELWERAANAIKTINGVQADGANNFDILPGAGIQVNPRANGIEIVATGAAPEDDGIKTINYVQPDEDGDFILRGGTGVDIEEIEDEEGINGLEISCTVEAPTYTGVSPIEINADNEITFKDWVKDETYQWAKYIEDGKTTTDIILEWGGTSSETTFTFIPKGTPSSLSVNIYSSAYSQIEIWDIPLSTLLRDRSSTDRISWNGVQGSGTQSGSGINQTITFTLGSASRLLYITNTPIYTR